MQLFFFFILERCRRLHWSELQVDAMQGGETTAQLLPVYSVFVCFLSDHAGGNVEDTVSSRHHGNHISFTGKEAEHFSVQNEVCELFHII